MNKNCSNKMGVEIKYLYGTPPHCANCEKVTRPITSAEAIIRRSRILMIICTNNPNANNRNKRTQTSNKKTPASILVTEIAQNRKSPKLCSNSKPSTQNHRRNKRRNHIVINIKRAHKNRNQHHSRKFFTNFFHRK